MPFISDVTGETVSAGVSYNSNEPALTVINKVRESLGWRLYGDNYGRVRFRNKVVAGSPVLALSQSQYILQAGLSFDKSYKDTINVIGATNVEGSLTIGSEVLIADYTGSAANNSLTINFASAGCYSNIWWQDETNDGTVYIEENGKLRNTGQTNSGTGSLNFKVSSIGGTPNYRIKAYGARITLSAGQFYVERSEGVGQNKDGINTTKLTVQNRFFKSASFAESFADQILWLKGKTRDVLACQCRGIADLEMEDSMTIDHPGVDSQKIFILQGQQKQFQSGSFKTVLQIEDSLIRSGDLRYDIGLKYDTGLKYDGG